MAISRAKKEEIVKDIRKALEGTRVVFFVDFPGIKASKINELRSTLKKLGATYQVVKKTLADIAFRDAEFDVAHLAGHKGSLACITGNANELEIAKAVMNFKKEHETLEVIGGFFGKDFLAKERIAYFARIPSKDVLLTQLAGLLVFPMRGLVFVLGGNLRKFVMTLDAVKRSKQ